MIKKLADNKFFRIGFEFHSKKSSHGEMFGRFGGGWNWKLGFQSGGNTLIISLLVAEVRIDFGGIE